MAFAVGDKALLKGWGTIKQRTVTVVSTDNAPMIMVRMPDGREEENAEFSLIPLEDDA